MLAGLFLFTERRNLTSCKVKHLQFRMEGALSLVRFAKITLLLHLELKMSDYGGSGTSARLVFSRFLDMPRNLSTDR